MVQTTTARLTAPSVTQSLVRVPSRSPLSSSRRRDLLLLGLRDVIHVACSQTAFTFSSSCMASFSAASLSSSDFFFSSSSASSASLSAFTVFHGHTSRPFLEQCRRSRQSSGRHLSFTAEHLEVELYTHDALD
eukprot:TRINITY_DN7088_c1_g3_i1.p1 TRINITY_DN7088_c1_g3~~TRINITY_DN7088_c1_g3_i1.p1  ORF type:complete len:133 (-),score=14.81 TRINITY_DN7088_c1_g3_i1:42-440(-)